MTDPLTAGQQRTVAARAALAAQFLDPESKRAHYRSMGQKAQAKRVVLPAELAKAIADSHAALARLTDIAGEIAERLERRAETGDDA